MSGLHSPTRLRVSTVCRAALLTVAAVTVWFFAFAFVAGIVEEFTREPFFEGQQHEFTFRNGGLPVWKTTWHHRGVVEKIEYHDLDGEPVEMSNREEYEDLHGLADTRIWRRPVRAKWKNSIVFLHGTDRANWFFEDFGQRGQFTIFDPVRKQRIGFVGLNGFSSEPLSADQQFPTSAGVDHAVLIPRSEDVRLLAGFSVSMGQILHYDDVLLLEPGGRRVHWIDRRKRASRVIHEGEPVLAACLDWQEERKTGRPRFVLRTQQALKVIAASESMEVTEVVPLPKRVQRLAMFVWIRTPDGPLFVEPVFTNGWKLTWATRDGEVIHERRVPLRNVPEDPSHAWIMPLVQIPVVGEFIAWAATHPEESDSRYIDRHQAKQLGLELARERPDIEAKWFLVPLIALHLSVLLWSVLAVRRLRRFDASVGEQLFWGAWILAFGLPGYLAFRVSVPSRMAALGRPLEISNLRFQISKGRTAEGGHPTARVSINEWLADSALALLARVGLSPGHAMLVVKEMRSVTLIGAAACAAYLLVVAKLTNLTGFGWMRTFVPEHSTQIPFLDEAFEQPFTVVSLLLAVCLAVWQTAIESRGGAWLFLLHRPVSRRAIVLSKLVVGLSVLLGCSALPIVLYGAWAARPGTHPSPFEWSMTNETWRLWWSMPPLYFGTLLTMLRPARWFGTRLLPCVAGFGWSIYRESQGAWLWPTWQEFAVVAAMDVVFVACLLLVSREREYP